jgi:hypothetical protein
VTTTPEATPAPVSQRRGRVAEETLHIPTQRWEVVQSRLNQYWTAREAPHISIMAQTRAGKSYLVTRGIMPLCRNDRVLMIDVKGNDRTTSGWGKPVRELPTKATQSIHQLWRGPKPEDHWFRLVTYAGPQNTERSRDQVRRALDRVLSEGDWVVYIDELRAVTDPSSPGLHLKPYYEEIILRGGSKGIASISLSQEPRWCPGAFYTQSNFYFFSRLEDEQTHKRISEVGSAKQLIPHIRTVPRRTWLYMDNMDDLGDRYWAKTTVTTPSRGGK